MVEPIVYLIDDDAAIHAAISPLINSVGLRIKTFVHPITFLNQLSDDDVGCIILDIRLPVMNGLAVHDHLIKQKTIMSTVFITGHGDVQQCRRAFKNGAVDFLIKPVDEQMLLDGVQKAVANSIACYELREHDRSVAEKFDRLTQRERGICDLVVAGLSNKLIAKQLGLALRTVENHRAAVFEKLGASSLAELVRICVVTPQNRDNRYGFGHKS